MDAGANANELEEIDYRDAVSLTGKLNYKYDVEAEKAVVGWINTLLNEQIPPGKLNLHEALKSGVLLCRLVNLIYQNSANLPAPARNVRLPIKFSNSNVPFKQMENIQTFLNSAEAYGVPRTSLFQTVDLFEAQNLSIVVSCVMQLGTECQRNGFKGPVMGPKPTQENRRKFTHEQLSASKTVIGLQAGTNKCASQKGMSFAAVRHSADGVQQLPSVTNEGKSTIGLQMGTNKYASQSGMSIGATRHITDVGGRYMDLSVNDISAEGKATISLQMGTNKFANQSGLSFGKSRGINDIRVPELADLSADGKATINLQMGYNQGATQSGMSFGAPRQIAAGAPYPAATSVSPNASLPHSPPFTRIGSPSPPSNYYLNNPQPFVANGATQQQHQQQQQQQQSDDGTTSF